MNKKRIVVIIATTSEDKIEGIREAFTIFFQNEEYEIKIYSSKVDSNVSEQPFGNDTYQGAYNRIENARKKYREPLKEQGITANYYVSCEAGIDDTNRIVINGESKTIYASEQIVCIYNVGKDSYSFGKSSSWTIPEKDIEIIKDEGLDQYLRKRECSGLHDVGDGSYITRKDAVREGACSAIASELFKERCTRVEQKGR